jgi:hypothetical protein
MEARFHALDALCTDAIPDAVSCGHVVSSLLCRLRRRLWLAGQS